MLKRICAFLAFCVIAFVLLSCSHVFDNTPPPPLPKAILIDFTFRNETQSPVTVKIRHKYQWQWDDTEQKDIISYTGWSAETIENGKSKAIGVEKYTLSDEKSIWEVEGFFLLDYYSASISEGAHYFYSSFELEIETEDDILFVSDDTERIRIGINATNLCYLKIFNPHNTCFLVTHKQSMDIKELFTLPVTLTLQADGSWTFEHDTVSDSDGVHVFPNYPQN